MYERLLTGGNITLFSPNDVPGLLDAFYADQDKFKELYELYEADNSIRKKVMPAIDVFSAFINERKDTGRIYLMNVDHANEHGSFDPTVAPIRQSNLCCVTGDTKVDAIIDGNPVFDLTIEELISHVYKNYDVKVQSYNIETNQYEYKLVTAGAMTRLDAELLKIEDDLGHYLVCTPDHKVYTKNRGYVMACDLNEDDELVYY